MNEPQLTLDEAKFVVSTKVHPRVTEQSIKDKIKNIEYHLLGTLTLCMITMKNNFKVTGVTAPADERNFDAEVGKRYAYDNAFKQLWQLEGYLLCERLHS